MKQAIIDRREVERRTSLSRRSVYSLISMSQFRKQVLQTLSGAVGWLASENRLLD